MWRWLKRTAILVAAAVVVAMGWFGWLHASGNFHEISPGSAYRAAQMDGQALVRWQREHGIATVLNLRGANPGSDWYETERAVTDRLGITHIDFRMSAARELDSPEALRLIEIMRDAPKPLLIHCMGGADRTGLAAALYVAGIDGGSEAQAEWHLSPAFGHVGIPWLSRAWAMDRTWERMEPELGFYDS
ncbi:MAG: tyrosine-protein phosphatase [Paracoccus sp. (in: a-proteobacteria)]|nr:tyrosine-protein phosphatase [Paracoccus sp. (in: a-proteobacteria)]